jgi:16S rRNA processing protein RimM
VVLGLDASVAEIVRPGLELFLEQAEDSQAYEVLTAERHGPGVLVKLSGVADRNEAEALAKREVFVIRESLPTAGPDEYYDSDIIGTSVITEDGRDLGLITDIIVTGANDVYVAMGLEGEVLIPAIDAAVVEIDPDARKMTVRSDALEFSAKESKR